MATAWMSSAGALIYWSKEESCVHARQAGSFRFCGRRGQDKHSRKGGMVTTAVQIDE